MGGFEPDEGLRASRQRFEEALPLARAGGQEAQKDVGDGRETRHGQRRGRRGRARHDLDDVTRRRGGGDEPLSGIRERGHAGIADQRDGLAAGKPFKELGDPGALAGRGAGNAPRVSSAKRAASLAVTRVSSQKIASASASTRRARGERSSRFPMGVPTTRRRPGLMSWLTDTRK